MKLLVFRITKVLELTVALGGRQCLYPQYPDPDLLNSVQKQVMNEIDGSRGSTA